LAAGSSAFTSDPDRTTSNQFRSAAPKSDDLDGPATEEAPGHRARAEVKARHLQRGWVPQIAICGAERVVRSPGVDAGPREVPRYIESWARHNEPREVRQRAQVKDLDGSLIDLFAPLG
jgi:hypothetical protein